MPTDDMKKAKAERAADRGAGSIGDCPANRSAGFLCVARNRGERREDSGSAEIHKPPEL
jgi:hypothetical protein